MSSVWDLVVDDETNKLCYMNALSLEKKFTKPIGLTLSKEQTEYWEKNKDKTFEDEKTVRSGKEICANVGEWEEAKPYEDFF